MRRVGREARARAPALALTHTHTEVTESYRRLLTLRCAIYRRPRRDIAPWNRK